ncbi:MAG: DUF305 domain-containing protein [Rhodococcus sp. (in: high G+C Gram-positive bacteria)]
MSNRIIASIAAAAIGAAVVTGCSDDTSTPHTTHSSSATTGAASTQSDDAQFNKADVMFAQMMYPHHAQAVDMAAMVDGRTDNAEVVALASAISAAQEPEMTQMAAWLESWDQPAPSEGMDGHTMDGGGMMSQEQMDSLLTLSGPEFDRQWLTMMIEHHSGAVEMAGTEIADGSNADAQELAREIVSSQQREIDAMQKLLG